MVIIMLQPLGSRILHSDRFILRPFVLEDTEMIFRSYLSDKDVCKFLEFNEYKSKEDVYQSLLINISRYQDPYYFHWAIVDKRNGFVIGSTSIHNINHCLLYGELGICLSKYYWHQGVGKEILSLIMDYGMQYIGFKHYQAFSFEENIVSRRLLLSLGLKESPENDRFLWKNGVKYRIKCLKI